MAKKTKIENPVPEDVEDEAETVLEGEVIEETEAAETAGAEEAPETEPKAAKASIFGGKAKKDQGQLLAEAADKYLPRPRPWRQSSRCTTIWSGPSGRRPPTRRTRRAWR